LALLLIRSHWLLLVGQVFLYLVMHIVSVKFCASSHGYTVEAFECVFGIGSFIVFSLIDLILIIVRWNFYCY